ncbi:protein FdrA [Planotetraspora silvatica]|uniref:Protein FdrA n=1 Tax=Planotetraspora silvatica TaxID=234614 RepID=A0A8J3UPU3_9ACTN|nr:FdrA family protein [Planotetraspora silvatica]GII46169.1 protein FdrA [Planotetraspora silvatica]
MSDLVEVRAGVYHDSVSLMRVSQALAARAGVEVAVVAMATELNVDLARDLGFAVPAATGGDLLVAIRASGDARLEEASAELDRQLTARAPAGGTDARDAPPRTTRSASRAWDATVALVSVPGEHAFVEAADAVEAGLSVMIFSDNVPVEQEILLKDRARDKGVLVMGPDCGTAVIGGAGLGFANVLRPGRVGVVAASGTGAQQVTSLLDQAGVGVSHLLGVGGRDLSAQVGGRSTTQALLALDEDPATELIVLVSKPPAPEVATAVQELSLSKPVVRALLGPGQDDLTTAVEKVLGALGVPVPEWPSWPAGPPPVPGGPLRGLYSGGTLCTEAALIAGTGEFTDFGDDEYTRGRAHPMIDPALRLEALAAVETGVVLLDVVLGHGSDPDPSASLAPAVEKACERGVAVVVALVGTEGDPQGLRAQAARLNEAGAAVFTSNAAAARHARLLIGAS